MSDTMTRKQAAEKGMHRYFTGKPCKNGHASLRFTATGACSDCLKLYSQKYRNEMHQNKIRKKLWHKYGSIEVTVQVDPRDKEFIIAMAELCRLYHITEKEDDLKLISDIARAQLGKDYPQF